VPSSPGQYAVIGCKLKQNAVRAATVVQVLQDLLHVLFMFYFTCDRSFSASVIPAAAARRTFDEVGPADGEVGSIGLCLWWH